MDLAGSSELFLSQRGLGWGRQGPLSHLALGRSVLRDDGVKYLVSSQEDLCVAGGAWSQGRAAHNVRSSLYDRSPC